jgi:pimeloyl-ACP methyl ester carboxylesterase
VLLLHQYGSNRASWLPLIPALLEAGFGVLTVDQRGHGDTGGGEDWELAEADVPLWIDWLRDQPGIDPENLSVAGASIGSNLALRSMANDERIVTAIALSPGLDYFGVTTEDALTTVAKRPVMLVAGQRDRESADAVRVLGSLAAGDVLVRIYTHGAHGTGIFMLEQDLVPTIVMWLASHS